MANGWDSIEWWRCERFVAADEKFSDLMRERRFTDSQKSLNAVRVMYRESIHAA